MASENKEMRAAQMEQDVKIENALKAFMVEFGYTVVQRSFRTSRQGTRMLLSLRFKDPDPEHAMTSTPMVEVFANDMYPNDKGEIILYQWNWVGFGVGKNLVERLRLRGYKARFTIRKGTNCVALVLPEAAQ